MRKLYFISLFSILAVAVSAQAISVSARIDSTSIWIGEQTRLTFEISQPEGQTVLAPLFSDSIVSGLEIVNAAKPDTTHQDNHLVINQSFTLTSFDDTLYYIPPFPFVAGGDTFYSNSLSLKVIQPFEIDTASNQIADIKTVYTPPFNWKKFLLTLALVLLIAAIVGLFVIFVVYKLIKRKKKPEEIVKYETRISPYDFAIQQLARIKDEKLWQQNRAKEYHTELTDVVREFIDRNYSVPSLEMTSEEILDKLIFVNKENKPAYNTLKQILTLADLVKFAKWNPLPSENEQSLKDAYFFVEETAIKEKEEKPEEEKIEEK
ncbi:MAG: BatD family protein [Paludibacter sp.]|jgi:hypothetical protein|nr:BatD family protein [Paludibacter sp.]